MDQNIRDDHSRTIIHIDMDCFYAQVEMIKNPSLALVPLGIQQKNIVVTSNYLARQYGIKKCMLVEDAKNACPDLVLVNGEDLRDYRQISYRVTDYLQNFTPLVERLGLDENYVDVTEIVAKREKCTVENIETIGHVYSMQSESCDCGCEMRLKIGTQIAQEIRNSIKSEFKLTTCAGIAHNKLLAKIVCSTHKPNQQTVLFPNAAFELLLSTPLKKIPGIGNATLETLKEINITNIESLQNCDLHHLTKRVGATKAKQLYELSYGLDNSPVKPSGKPQSIGLEDACKTITIEAEIKEKLLQLLKRLTILIREDGRLPKTLKLTVRKFDKTTKTSRRETKQCGVSPSLFFQNELQLSENSQIKLMALIMHLFNKIVDTTKPYHITLLGLSCTKFQEQQHNNLTNFFKKNLEVQSVTSLENKNTQSGSPMECDLANISTTSDLDSESEPSPKKFKFVISKKRCLTDNSDCMSPSKLSVANLRLNSTEKQENSSVLTPDTNQNILCPPNADEDVFKELPKDLQKELWEDYKRDRDKKNQITFQNQIKKPKTNTLLNYFVKS